MVGAVDVFPKVLYLLAWAVTGLMALKAAFGAALKKEFWEADIAMVFCYLMAAGVWILPKDEDIMV